MFFENTRKMPLPHFGTMFKPRLEPWRWLGASAAFLFVLSSNRLGALLLCEERNLLIVLHGFGGNKVHPTYMRKLGGVLLFVAEVWVDTLSPLHKPTIFVSFGVGLLLEGGFSLVWGGRHPRNRGTQFSYVLFGIQGLMCVCVLLCIALCAARISLSCTLCEASNA